MNHFTLLLLVVFVYGCSGNSTKPLLQKSPYDASFRHYAERLDGKKRKAKHIKKMETAYQLAQRSDLLAADSMLNLDKPDRWLYINAYHRRIQGRQQKVLALLPLQSKDGYNPDFLIVNNIDARESASRQAAAQYLYQMSEDLLATETRADARKSYYTLVDLKENYYPVWENAAELLDSAARVGVEHILVESDIPFAPGQLDSKWQRFYRDPNSRSYFDIVVQSHGLYVNVGPDDEQTTYYTESKQIEVGYTEKKDSSGHVIERTPIYETISATVTEVEVNKSADAGVWVDVIDASTGALMQTQEVSATYRFSDKSVSVSGDRRALSSCPFETGSVFTPSYWAMESKVLDALNWDFRQFVKSRLWTGE